VSLFAKKKNERKKSKREKEIPFFFCF